MDQFLENTETIMTFVAKIAIYLLEVIGIIVIVIGAVRVIVLMCINEKNKNNPTGKHYNIKINLANALALGLEFKMGSEIIKTVIIKEVSELLILGAIILLRAILAILIHWEIKVASKDEKAKKELENKPRNNDLALVVDSHTVEEKSNDKVTEEVKVSTDAGDEKK